MFLPHKHHAHVLHYKEHSLFPILSSEKLLHGPEQQEMLEKIRKLLPIPDEYYNELYAPLIHDFVEFVQAMPIVQGGPLGELLNIGLERAIVALQVLTELKLVQTNELLTYAIFSAALLQDVGWVIYRRYIMIADKYGTFVREWTPHTGAMVGQGEYFKMLYLYDSPEGLNSLLNPFFWHMLMPSKGLTWLMSDRRLFAMWLAWCEEDEDSVGGLALRLNLIQERLKVMLEKRQNPVPIMVELYDPPDIGLGEAFWKWLRDNLQNGKIQVNSREEGVFAVEEGILIDQDVLFEKFSRVHAKHPKADVVREQFLTLGLTGGIGLHSAHAKYFFTPDNTNQQSVEQMAAMKSSTSLFQSDKKTSTHAPQYQKMHTDKVHKLQEYIAGPVLNPGLVYKADQSPPVMPFLKAAAGALGMGKLLGKVSGHALAEKGFNPELTPPKE